MRPRSRGAVMTDKVFLLMDRWLCGCPRPSRMGHNVISAIPFEIRPGRDILVVARFISKS
jgi:hypothetical protein